MEQTCILPGGCPCANRSCPRHGICHECVGRHASDDNDVLVACQRAKAKRLYGTKKAATV